MNVGQRIKARREELSLSAEKLGQLIGKAKTTIYRYESGYIETIPSSILEDLAKALKTTPAYLMGWTDNPDRELSDKEKEFIEAVKNMSDDEIDKMNDYLSFILSKRK